MKQNSLLSKYRTLNQSYYYIYEYYYFDAIKNRLPGSLGLKELVVLTTIEKMQKHKTNTSAQIALAVQMTPSSFSNYLRTLEKNHLIARRRGTTNLKLMYINTTPEGKRLIVGMRQFMQGFVRELIQDLGIKGTLQFSNGILKVSFANRTLASPTLTSYTPGKVLNTITEGMRNINLLLFASEEKAYSVLNPSMSIREMRFLHAILELHENVTPTMISQYLGIPMSSLTTMIRKLEREDLIQRTVDPTDLRKYTLTLQPNAIPLIDYFMSWRLRVFTELTSILNDKERELLERSFQVLKTYCQS
jgi:DNA-binding MarR family transcriptional regulator